VVYTTCVKVIEKLVNRLSIVKYNMYEGFILSKQNMLYIMNS